MSGGCLESPARLAELGRALCEHGLTPAALQHVLGLKHPIPVQVRATVAPPTPATQLAHLFVAGSALDATAIRNHLGELFDSLCEVGLLAIGPDATAAALRCVVPLGGGRLAVSPWDLLPDDSSLHLVGALPGRRVPSWLDVGTGSAFAPLFRPGLADTIVGTDVVQAVVSAARLGVALSNVQHVDIREADLFVGDERRWSLITFNAPIPDDDGALLERFFAGAGDRVTAGGEILVHSRLLDRRPCHACLPGTLETLEYTPAGEDMAFGVSRWRPGGRPSARWTRIELTKRLPHVQRHAFDTHG